jgi:asparagine synthase (glutamine-hydrolysing)
MRRPVAHHAHGFQPTSQPSGRTWRGVVWTVFSPASAPFFGAKKRADGFAVRGALSCELGHRVPAGANGPDDGVFASWKWHGHMLTVETDRYGFCPLFYYSRGNEFGISSNLVRLLQEGAPLEIDREAVAVFLHLGFFIGNQTPFLHIKAVPPNRSFTWDGTLHVEEVRHVGSQLAISRAEAIEQFAQMFRSAIARRLPPSGDFALPLSGGRDSRHILFELCEAGYRPRYCITASRYGAGDNDVEIARLLTQSFGLKHIVVGQRPRFEAELRKNIATSFCADEHAWLVPAAELLSTSVDTIYDGIAGDVLSASLFATRPWLDLHRAGRFRELAETLMKPDTKAIQRTLDPAFRIEHGDDIAREQIMRELERYAGAANPTTMFFFWNRTRREIALSPFGVFSGVKTCFCPYLDHQLFDLLASLPAEMLMDKKFHSDTISAAHPRFADMPYAVPRHQRRAMRETLIFSARVGGYGVAARPSRVGRMARLTAHLLRSAVSSAYRKNNASIGPAYLLYFFQLDQTIRKTASLC